MVRRSRQLQRLIRNNPVAQQQNGQKHQEYNPRNSPPYGPLLEQPSTYEPANNHEREAANQRIARSRFYSVDQIGHHHHFSPAALTGHYRQSYRYGFALDVKTQWMARQAGTEHALADRALVPGRNLTKKEGPGPRALDPSDGSPQGLPPQRWG